MCQKQEEETLNTEKQITIYEIKRKLEKNSGKRVLVYLVICYGLGIYFSVSCFPAGETVCLPFLLCGALFALLLSGFGQILRQKNQKGKVVLLLGLYLGIFRVYLFDSLQLAPMERTIEEGKPISGTVLEDPALSSTGKTLAITLGELESGDKKIHGKIIVYCKNTSHVPKRRSRIQISADLEVIRLRGEPVFQDYRRYLLTEGITGRGFCTDFEELAENVYPQNAYGLLLHLAENTRDKIQEAAEKGIADGENRALLLGILIGEKGSMTQEQYANIRNAGFSHVVAVSGMHLSYLVFLLTALFAFDPTNGRKLAKLLLLPFLAWFVMVANHTPSVCRAAIMSALVSIGYLSNRTIDTMTSIFLAGLILLVYNPYLLYSMSFTLSFGSTIGIVVFSRKIEQKFSFGKTMWVQKLGNKIWGLTAMTLGAILGISYLSALYFGTIQLGGLIGNIFVIPLVVYVFVGGYIQTTLYVLLPGLGIPFGRFLIEPALRLLNWNFDWLSRLDLQIGVQSFGASGAVLYLLLCAALYYFLCFPQKRKQF